MAAGIEILYKLMGEKLSRSPAEELNHCHYFQLICFDLCLGAAQYELPQTRGKSLSICSCDVLLTYCDSVLTSKSSEDCFQCPVYVC